MKPSRRIILIIVSLFLLSSLSAQEEPETSEELTSDVQTSVTLSSADFVLQFEPGFYLNPASRLVSSPSPIIYPISIGFLWPEHSVIAVQPTISFFMMNHLLYEDKALPAEIENRTTTTLSFMLNIPAVYSIYLTNSNFQITAGLGVFMRFGILSPGIKEEDSGWSGSAGGDVKKINSYFWGNMRWLYLTIGGSWLYNLTPQLRAGPTINVYVPVGGLISDGSAQAMIISVGIKICR